MLRNCLVKIQNTRLHSQTFLPHWPGVESDNITNKFPNDVNAMAHGSLTRTLLHTIISTKSSHPCESTLVVTVVYGCFKSLKACTRGSPGYMC